MNTTLLEVQRRMAELVMQPLTRAETMRKRGPAGQSSADEAAAFIRPNDRLSSFERLEIYNRQYWFRLFSSFEDDFPGLQSVLGARRFQSLMRDYLEAHPSSSFTLRNLGSRLCAWLEANPRYLGPQPELAREMAALEWAHIEAFDNAAWPRLTPEALGAIGADSRLFVQPYLRLMEAHYAIDDLLIAVRSKHRAGDPASNHASTGHGRQRRRTLSQAAPQHIFLAVHRHEDTVYYRRLAGEDFRLLQHLQRGASLGEAIEFAFETSTMAEERRPPHLQAAFAHWSSLGWLCTPPDAAGDGVAS